MDGGHPLPACSGDPRFLKMKSKASGEQAEHRPNMPRRPCRFIRLISFDFSPCHPHDSSVLPGAGRWQQAGNSEYELCTLKAALGLSYGCRRDTGSFRTEPKWPEQWAGRG